MSDSGTEAQLKQLADQVRAGKPIAIARAVSLIERGDSSSGQLLELLRPAPNKPVQYVPRIGITGPPGTGKSTLVSRLVANQRAEVPGTKVAVVAVDPSSPFSGGALLGDRFRMSEVSDDPGVFIRSMASRGAVGGLSEATESACDIMEAAGYGEILIETVGVGQNEVAIASACETTVVVLNPESGDSVQALKAGLLEVADVLVVNKGDHPRTARFVADLESGIELQARQHGGWQTTVVTTIATSGAGVYAVWDAIMGHRSWLASTKEGERRKIERTRERIRRLWHNFASQKMDRNVAAQQRLETAALSVVRGHATAWTAAMELANPERW